MAEKSTVEVEITVDLSELEGPQQQSTPAPPNPPPPPSPSEQPPRPQGLLNRGRRKKPNQNPSGLLTPSGIDSPSPRKPLGFLTELVQSRRLRRNRPTLTSATPDHGSLAPTPGTEDGETPQNGTLTREQLDTAIKTGYLSKTSCSRRKEPRMGPSRERRFRLTEEALEYFQHFSQVKVRRSFPLTSIEKIEYEPDSKEPGPRAFKLLFPTYIMTLQSETVEDAKDWVEKIEKAWKMWQLLPGGSKGTLGRNAGPSDSILSPPSFPAGRSFEREMKSVVENGAEIEGEGEEEELYEEEQTGPSTASLPPAAAAPPKKEDGPKETGGAGPVPIRPRSRTWDPDLRRDSSMDMMGTYDRKKRFGRQAFRFKKVAKLAPRLEKTTRIHAPDKSCEALHYDYAMIKYPRSKWSIPSEKLFKIDKDNLSVLWRRNQSSTFKKSNCLSLHRILEIREGQLTNQFDRFPYDEVWYQSFSIVFEEMKKGGKYVGLVSLDLICDSTDSFKEWMEGLRTVVPGFQASIFPFQYDNTDPTILWLKQLWSCYSSDHEITEKTAIKLARRFKSTLTWKQARIVIKEAHTHQFRHTFNYGNALRWDGFVAVTSLLCGLSGRLFRLFRKYARKYPRLGMTPEELKEFLISECYWEPRMCTSSDIHRLIYHHDYHHRAFKKYVAQNKPFDFQIVSKLLSYAGFLSFLRSKDNSAVNIEHNNIYQDMNQPLSHYFINSSHNTYLEEDQLYGRSSTDAYVRTLIQGCRCIEIDCWDETLRVTGVSEPVIYHGYTFTTKLPFRDVIETIRDYAFNFSNYPVIVSIENHCSKSQQVKMAKIFEEVMGDILALENLVESQGRNRLPSPQELQGKILLKGSYRKIKGSTKKPRREHSTDPHRPTVSPPQTSVKTTHDSVISDNIEAIVVDFDPESSVDAIKLTFDSSQTHEADPKQVREWARLAEQDDKTLVFTADDQELVFATVPELQCLIPYCRSVSIKPWDWQKQMQTTVSEMFSFGESSANKHCDNSSREMLACSERQLVRTYPKGVRFDSSNYDPIPMWNCGMQLVALNWQYPDIFMHLNQGLFRLNGGCGYVLKPEVMRRPDPAGGHTPYLPTMTEPHPDVPPVDLEIELLSGQWLCFWKKKCSTLTVEIHTCGIPHDTDKMQPPATAQDNNTFWPQWQERLHVYRKKVLMPELCLVYFRVDVVLKGSGLGAKAQLYGQNCISLVSLMPGIKFIPLRTPGGELIPESGLFVQIKKKKLSSLTRQGSTPEGHPHADRLKTLDRGDSTEQFFSNVDVTASIHPSLLRQREMDQGAQGPAPPPDSGRPISSPPLLESHFSTTEEQASWKSKLDKLVSESRSSQGGEKQLEVVAEVHDYEDEGENAASSEVATVTFEGFEDEKGVITVPFESTQEVHLEVNIPDSDC